MNVINVHKWLAQQPSRVSSASVIVEDDQGRVLVTKAIYKNYWTFPGGVVEKGETPKQAAVREIFEEMGVTVALQSLEFVSVVDRKSEIADTYLFIFRSTEVLPSNIEIVLQDGEMEGFDFVSRHDVLADERRFNEAVKNWANGHSGYFEQAFLL